MTIANTIPLVSQKNKHDQQGKTPSEHKEGAASHDFNSAKKIRTNIILLSQPKNKIPSTHQLPPKPIEPIKPSCLASKHTDSVVKLRRRRFALVNIDSEALHPIEIYFQSPFRLLE